MGVFYAENGMVKAQDSEWIQNYLNVPIGLFWWYGIVANVLKSRTMTRQPRTLRLGMLKEAVV